MSQKRMQVENIGFKYKNNYGINQISFDVMKGDFIALVGENGAGKTTLIKAILGLLESEGDVLIEDGMEVNDISFCSQNISIDWYLSVYDNILMGGLFSRQSQRKIKQEIDQILDLVELKQYKKSDPNNLSGGQQQRIQIARALMGSPKLIFLDEPTVGLDVVLANKLLKYLSYLCKQGTSIIIASHDLQLLEAYCNKVLYLKEGHMIYYGEIETFLNHYKHNDTLEISYEGELSVALIKEMNQIATVLNVKPLVVETVIEKKDQLIRMVVNSGVSINTIVTKGKTLREIIMEDQNEKTNL